MNDLRILFEIATDNMLSRKHDIISNGYWSFRLELRRREIKRQIRIVALFQTLSVAMTFRRFSLRKVVPLI